MDAKRGFEYAPKAVFGSDNPRPSRSKASALQLAKAPAEKAAPKSKAASKQKTPRRLKAAPKTRRRAKPESDDENCDYESALNNDSLLSNTPPCAKKQKKGPAPKKDGKAPIVEIESGAFNTYGAAIEDKPISKPGASKKKDAGSSNYAYELPQLELIDEELILSPMADNQRSIPSVIDGFTPGQRKVLYTCFCRNLKKHIKVVELAGSVSGLTAYAYGDKPLQDTIVSLAQNFVGSNNINCLEPTGNFGSRLHGGQDAASARYIYTRLSPFARRVFHHSDEPLLTYNTNNGKMIEPELINGADAIGTGCSTSIPNYKPDDVIENLKRHMDDREGRGKGTMIPMTPWYRKWAGEVEQIDGDHFKFSGTLSIRGDNQVEITELTVRIWTQDFKDRLENMVKAEKVPAFIKDYIDYNTAEKVHFIIKMEENKISDNQAALAELFKLAKPMATSNLVAFDAHGHIHKYGTPLDTLEEFYQVRLSMYQKRKQYMLVEMEKDLAKMTNPARFVQMIIDGKLFVSKKKKAVIVAELKKLGFRAFPKGVNAQKDDESDDAETAANAGDFDYLLGMDIWSLTQERVQSLMKQIGEKEEEIDILTSKSATDLWRADLDLVMEEWNRQLNNEEDNCEKKACSKRGPAHAKFGVGSKDSKKRNADDSDDFVSCPPYSPRLGRWARYQRQRNKPVE
ncbi:DNA topoisomerase [Hortaea werneckii]|nr:DNA topoisomerase [Hortaea werneckii]KAI7028136.1 DNA topoisomerase [Hortaea werneckii]KAI7676738.1 DNA topoisomerase [Hortaea werneckii]